MALVAFFLPVLEANLKFQVVDGKVIAFRLSELGCLQP